MNAIPEQAWRCLRGHENEPDRRSCEVCHLPRWLNRYTLSIAGVVLLLGLLYGGYSLSRSLKEWQYQSLVRQAWMDTAISPQERQELEAQRTYLGVSDEQARQWEAAITGAVLEPPLDRGLPLPGEGKTLTGIRQALEQGRLSEARQAITVLHAEHPQDAEIARLKEEIEQRVKSRIEVKLLGDTSGTHVLDAQVALVTLSGREASFRFYVEPHEDLYFYLYGEDRTGNINVLFPALQASGSGFNPLNPLLARQAYWVPSEIPEKGFPLQREAGHIEEITMVTSRWPARELEEWGAALLAGAGGEEASQHLLQALKERQEAQVGGCDVRTLKFAR